MFVVNWVESIALLTAGNRGFVVVTVLETRGSSPRDRQSKMVVTMDASHDTIGGGNLEYRAIEHARRLLSRSRAGNECREYTLGKDLSQCCGGRVELLFECFPACDFHVALFGAGHVGSALVRILAGLPCRVTWFDGRKDVLGSSMAESGMPGNVTSRLMENPHAEVEGLPPGTWYLVMTHSHETDFELVEAILSRSDFPYCGLIGSRAKAASFRKRLSRKGFSDTELSRLTSPIGVDLGGGKMPMEVAVSVAAQLLGHYRSGVCGSGSLSAVS